MSACRQSDTGAVRQGRPSSLVTGILVEVPWTNSTVSTNIPAVRYLFLTFKKKAAPKGGWKGAAKKPIALGLGPMTVGQSQRVAKSLHDRKSAGVISEGARSWNKSTPRAFEIRSAAVEQTTSRPPLKSVRPVRR